MTDQPRQPAPSPARNRLQRLMWWLLVVAIGGIPLLVTHQTERTLWRVSFSPETFILNTAKIELILVDIALTLMVLGLIGITLTSADHRQKLRAHLGQVMRQLGGVWWLLLIVWGLISVAWSSEPALTLYRSLHVGIALVAALLTAYVVRQGMGKWVIGGLLLAALIQSGIGIAQFINDAPLGLTWLEELQTVPNSPFAEESTRLRAYGLSLHPNILAGFLMLAILFGMLLANQVRWQIGVVCLGIIALSFAALLATSSRLPLLVTLATGLLVFVILLFSRVRLNLVTGGGVAIGAGVLLVVGLVMVRLLFPDVWTRFSWIGNADAVTERASYAFVNTVPLVEAHPVTGVGNGASVVEIGNTWEGSQVLLLPAHNTYVFLWSELGAVGVFLFLSGLLSALRWAHPKNGQAVMVSGIALLGVMILMIFDYYFWGEPRSQTLLFWLVGMLWGYALLTLDSNPIRRDAHTKTIGR